MTTDLRLVALTERPELEPQIQPIVDAGWSEFMLNDPTADDHWDRLWHDLVDYQRLLVDTDGRVVAVANSVPFCRARSDAYRGGWDAVLRQGCDDFDSGRAADTVSALSITIARDALGHGHSATMANALRSVARGAGVDLLVAPVRPSWKARYPLIPMDEYIGWTRPDGSLFDPWLRTHVRLGGTIIEVCPRSMVIPAPIAQWEAWSELAMPASGEYVVAGALAPVTVDRDLDVATYVEANVWVHHNL